MIMSFEFSITRDDIEFRNQDGVIKLCIYSNIVSERLVNKHIDYVFVYDFLSTANITFQYSEMINCFLNEPLEHEVVEYVKNYPVMEFLKLPEVEIAIMEYIQYK
jgi:hypothetical protein